MKIVTCVLTKCLKWALIPDSVCRILGYETSFDQRSWDTRFPSTKDSGVWSSPQSRILGYEASFYRGSWGMKLPSTKDPGVWSFLRPCFQALTHVLKGSAQTSSEPCLLGRREAWTFMTLWGVSLSKRCTLAHSSYQLWTSVVWVVETFASSSCQLWTSAVCVVGTVARSSYQLWTSGNICRVQTCCRTMAQNLSWVIEHAHTPLFSKPLPKPPPVFPRLFVLTVIVGNRLKNKGSGSTQACFFFFWTNV